jgi:hypothetical protein
MLPKNEPHLNNSHERGKRKEEIQKILDKFISNWHKNPHAAKLTLIENAAQKLTDKYFDY